MANLHWTPPFSNEKFHTHEFDISSCQNAAVITCNGKKLRLGCLLPKSGVRILASKWILIAPKY